MIAPPALTRALRAAAFVAGWHVQWPAQAALAAFIESGLLARHVRKMRRTYAARHERILRKLESTFGPWLDPVPSVAGMHVAARIRAGGVRLEREVAARAWRVGVGFDRLSSYCASGTPQAGVVLGYGAIAGESIDEGLRRLRKCFVAATRYGAVASTPGACSAPRRAWTPSAFNAHGCSGESAPMPEMDLNAKAKVLELVHGLPDDSSYDEILQELAFNRMVARGLADADAGRTISDEDMERTPESWRD